MNQSELLQKLMATFLEELHENVATLNEHLLALEKEPASATRPRHIEALFRAAHSLKGAARSVNVPLLEKACHQLEEILAGVRDGVRPLGQEIFGLLFDVTDAIEEAGRLLAEQRELTGSRLSALLPQLESAALALPSAALPPMQRPAVPPAAPVEKDVPMSAEPLSAGSVRIAAEKLNELLARVGELLSTRRRIDARLSELNGLRDQVEIWKQQWLHAEKDLRRLVRGDETEHRQGLSPRAAAVLGQAAEQWRRIDRELERLAGGLAADGRLFDQVFTPLDEEVRQVRMLPFSQACEGLERLARDLARNGNKEVDVLIEGGEVELDRSILDGIKDPLRQLLRNAIDHGVEPPAQREQAGKRPRAQITITAAIHGNQVDVTVADDGAGIDFEALRSQVQRRGIAEPNDPRDLARLIFLPGLSTAPTLTEISGRGVGLDIVKSRIEALHGTIDLTSAAGAGTRFTMTLPLTLTTLRAVLFQSNGQTYALAGVHVRKLARVAASALTQVVGRTAVRLDGTLIPLADLGPLLTATPPPERHGKMQLVIVTAGGQEVALVVDELLAEQEILIKSLGPRMRRLHYVIGATLLASGRLALVLNPANLVRAALRPGAEYRPARTALAAPARKRLLIAEDSATTRTLMKSILEAAGYDIVTTPDGNRAWQALQEQPFDLVVSDVEMPELDGFGLTERVRSSPRLRQLPVVLVTARSSEQDRLRGMQAGANGYVPKSSFDQRELLETVAHLI
jgi:two-component system, chemotaxis family, sensor kinase CheA